MSKLMIDKLNNYIKEDNMDILKKIAEDLYEKDTCEKNEFINRYYKSNYYTLEICDDPMDNLHIHNKVFYNRHVKK
jgi:hypothetical protein